jgi:hypothetical protein
MSETTKVTYNRQKVCIKAVQINAEGQVGLQISAFEEVRQQYVCHVCFCHQS